jgi:hypothetical protein
MVEFPPPHASTIFRADPGARLRGSTTPLGRIPADAGARRLTAVMARGLQNLTADR